VPTLEAPAWQIPRRSSAVYPIPAIALRLIPARQAGSLSPNDPIARAVVGGLPADDLAVGAASPPDRPTMVGVVSLWGRARSRQAGKGSPPGCGGGESGTSATSGGPWWRRTDR
jgi:hypothetical protein